MSDSNPKRIKKPAKKAAEVVQTDAVEKLLGEFAEQSEQLDREAIAAGVPLLIGEATVRLVLTIPEQSPPLTAPEAVRAAILEIAEAGMGQFAYVVQDQEREYLVARGVVLNDEE